MADPVDDRPTGAAGVDARDAAADARSRHRIWNLPNQLTIARFVLSIVFFVLLALDRGARSSLGFGGLEANIVLNVAFVVFILAVVTDFLDGYFARKWQLVSTFGRIADPFADKVVICGGFVMLTGVAPDLVQPWFAVVVMVREFLVSGLRSFLESRGVPFGAVFSGKLKMILQSVTIPFVLFHESNLSVSDASWSWVVGSFRWITVGLLAATLLITVISSFDYIRRAVALIRTRDE